MALFLFSSSEFVFTRRLPFFPLQELKVPQDKSFFRFSQPKRKAHFPDSCSQAERRKNAHFNTIIEFLISRLALARLLNRKGRLINRKGRLTARGRALRAGKAGFRFRSDRRKRESSTSSTDSQNYTQERKTMCSPESDQNQRREHQTQRRNTVFKRVKSALVAVVLSLYAQCLIPIYFSCGFSHSPVRFLLSLRLIPFITRLIPFLYTLTRPRTYDIG